VIYGLKLSDWLGVHLRDEEMKNASDAFGLLMLECSEYLVHIAYRGRLILGFTDRGLGCCDQQSAVADPGDGQGPSRLRLVQDRESRASHPSSHGGSLLSRCRDLLKTGTRISSI